MDYSEFVSAVLKNDEEKLNELSDVIFRVLIKFLIVRMDARSEDAEDSAQNALMLVIEKIRNDKLKNPDTLIYYLFTTAKNDYLKQLNRKKESNYEEIPVSVSEKPDQLENLLDEERLQILNYCMKKLRKDYYDYIKYWFDHPGDEAVAVANHFGISVSNAWTKKHRILQILKKCVRKNLNM